MHQIQFSRRGRKGQERDESSDWTEILGESWPGSWFSYHGYTLLLLCAAERDLTGVSQMTSFVPSAIWLKQSENQDLVTPEQRDSQAPGDECLSWLGQRPHEWIRDKRIGAEVCSGLFRETSERVGMDGEGNTRQSTWTQRKDAQCLRQENLMSVWRRCIYPPL